MTRTYECWDRFSQDVKERVIKDYDWFLVGGESLLRNHRQRLRAHYRETDDGLMFCPFGAALYEASLKDDNPEEFRFALCTYSQVTQKIATLDDEMSFYSSVQDFMNDVDDGVITPEDLPIAIGYRKG